MDDKHLDLRKELCPRPMIMFMSTIKTLTKGEVLSVTTSDSTTKQSIPKLCERAGFTLLEVSEEGGDIRFRVRK